VLNTLIHILSHTRLKNSGLVALLLFVTGCANILPGMHLDTKYVPTTPARSHINPVIKLITPTLLQKEKAAKAQQPGQDISRFIGEPQPYVIGNGDLLSVLVWNHPHLNIATAAAQALTGSGAQTPGAFVVDQNGIVQFPYVGPIRLAGLTELQARNLLAEKLIKSIKAPDITLRVQGFRSKRIYIDGDVKTSGNQVIDDVPMTLLEAFTRAGGLLPTADQSHIVITRAGVSYPINLPLLVRQGVDPSNIMLAHGDVVRVRANSENKVYVLGEVNTPKALLMNNGRLTLTEALGEAGGLNLLSSAARQVYVIRNAGEAEPIVYNLDAQSPVALALAENFELNPRDVVYVDTAGLARFNRMISLIIPTAAAAAASATAVK
jgi:polysaccharide export outer membrane protein